MEALITKKAALQAKLPSDEISSETPASAPPAINDYKTSVEIHPQPQSRSQSSATITSVSGRKN